MVGTKQYSDILKYDNLIILNDSVETMTTELKESFDGLIKDELLLNQSTYKVVNNEDKLDIYVVVPEDEDLFYKYFVLNDINKKKKITFKEGIIITPKIAQRFNLEVGDTFTIEDSNKNTYKIKVGGIIENYVSNYIYMTPSDYKKIFNKDVSYNVVAAKNIKDNDEVAKRLLETKKILTISFSDDLLKSANEMVEGLDEVVVLLVVISCMLAITVLYNLTSINISERTREIATLKVLGFRDNESNQYIYRETLITAVIGIILGLLITPPLHDMVMGFLEVDTLVFLRTIKIESFIYASLLTLLFVLIMQVVTYFKLKKIDLIEPLKSVE
jgi:putative ABC transport system permease protein